MSDPNMDWIEREFAVIHEKLANLTTEERNAHLVPGSRSIMELLEHIRAYAIAMNPDMDCHTAYHLGEIGMLVKVALARRSQP